MCCFTTFISIVSVISSFFSVFMEFYVSSTLYSSYLEDILSLCWPSDPGSDFSQEDVWAIKLTTLLKNACCLLPHWQAQSNFSWCFQLLYVEDRQGRFWLLMPSSCVSVFPQPYIPTRMGMVSVVTSLFPSLSQSIIFKNICAESLGCFRSATCILNLMQICHPVSWVFFFGGEK